VAFLDLFDVFHIYISFCENMVSILSFSFIIICILLSTLQQSSSFTLTETNSNIRNTISTADNDNSKRNFVNILSAQCSGKIRKNKSSMILQVLSSGEELVSTSIWEDLATFLLKIQYPTVTSNNNNMMYPDLPEREKLRRQLVTILRVGLPSAASGLTAFLFFPIISLGLADLFNNEEVLFVLSTDSSQFIQDMQVVVGFLFSLLIGQTYYFMYQQQESIYNALFSEVSEAKSLLEQSSLVCQGRGFYPQILRSINQYVEEDLKKLRSFEPAVLLSKKPSDDPLESIMYLTSVGLPGTIYDTVRSLRQARAERLGALQRKLPQLHLTFLWLLASLELLSFPVLGAGVQTVGGYNTLTVEGIFFGVMASGVVMVMLVVYELYSPSGGAYNVDGVLGVMVRGMEEELDLRMKGDYGINSLNPTAEKFNDGGNEMVQLLVDQKQEELGKVEDEEIAVKQSSRSRVNRWLIKKCVGWLEE